MPAVPKKIVWVNGPAKVELGGLAQARILEGFRFADPENAKIVLDTTHAAVPEGLLGVISPASGDYYVVLQFNDAGYMRDAVRQPLDEDAILKAVWDRTTRQNAKRVHEGAPNIVHVEWVLKPIFDVNSRLLESAMRTDGRAENQSLVNYTLQRLGRRGVLQASVVKQRHDFSDFAIVREAIRAITFKPGEDYRDYKDGDKLATASMAELITAEDSPTGSFLTGNGAAALATASTSGFRAVWIGLGVIGCVGLAGTVMLARRFRQYRANQPGQAQPETAARGGRHRNGSTRLKLDVRSKASKHQYSHPQNGNGNGNGSKRRRMFNYHKFYTEMVLQGPAPSVSEPMPVYNGFNGYNGYNGYNGNGNGNSNSNGNGNGHNGNGSESGMHAESSSSSANGSGSDMLGAHSELIASQMALIEEQKRLIHEQARLIEEKSKLIFEKNQLLDRQSEMIDNNLL